MFLRTRISTALAKVRLGFLVQLDYLRLADHSHERSDPLRQLRSDVACWSTAARARFASGAREHPEIVLRREGSPI